MLVPGNFPPPFVTDSESNARRSAEGHSEPPDMVKECNWVLAATGLLHTQECKALLRTSLRRNHLVLKPAEFKIVHDIQTQRMSVPVKTHV